MCAQVTDYPAINLFATTAASFGGAFLAVRFRDYIARQRAVDVPLTLRSLANQSWNGQPQQGSARFTLNQHEIISVMKGALLAGAGAVITWLAANWIPTIDKSTTTGIIVAAIASTAINFLQKLLTNKSPSLDSDRKPPAE
jgi:hypothetical protein